MNEQLPPQPPSPVNKDEVIEGIARWICDFCGDDHISKPGMTFGEFKTSLVKFREKHKKTCEKFAE